MPLPIGTKGTALLRHQEAVRRCRLCLLEGFQVTPPPVVSGRPECQVMLVGQAPALASTESGRNFSGRAGRILFSWFGRLGLTEEQVRASVYITALTRCYPGRAPRGGDRKPSPRELTLCRPFLLTELDLLAPRVVLPVGQMAIEHFLGKAPLGTRVGGVFGIEGVSFIPLPHPSGASRWLNEVANKRLLDQALERVRVLALPLIRRTLALGGEPG